MRGRPGHLAGGTNLSAGQFYTYTYDNKGEVLSEQASDTYLGALATHTWTYSPRGAVVSEGQRFADGIGVGRYLQYNRRGQRTQVSDDVSAGGAQVAGDAQSTLTYTYDPVSGRLTDLVGLGTSGDTVATVNWAYDQGGREIRRRVTLPGSSAPYLTTTGYDAAGRVQSITTTLGGVTYYSYSATSFDAADRVTAASETVLRGQTAAQTTTQYTYDSTGTGRLLSVHATTDGVPWTAAWSYDVFGNRVSTYSSTDACGIVPLRYGPDNRLVARDSTPSCGGEHYWSDQAGRRLGSTITGYTAPPADSALRTTLSYTAQGQLYYAVTPTDDIGHWDYTWHWYDGQGRRLMSQLVPYHEGRDALDPKTVTDGRRDYYIYDGDELTLTLSHGSDGGWRVAQRILSAGIDGALAGRYWTPDAGSPQSLFVLRDRQGTTLGAYRADGTADPLSWYQPLGAFGAPAGDGSTTSGGKSSATATGFTGAGAPSASGGYVYLRNRWYDPQTGRFLTQDPIGLAGGINLYAYAGNDPVNFSDPFGLKQCPEPPCRSEDDPLKDRPLPPNVDEEDVTWDSSLNKGKGGYRHDQDGTILIPHPDDKWHWDHWDIKTPGKARPWAKYPSRSLKPEADGAEWDKSWVDPWPVSLYTAGRRLREALDWIQEHIPPAGPVTAPPPFPALPPIPLIPVL